MGALGTPCRIGPSFDHFIGSVGDGGFKWSRVVLFNTGRTCLPEVSVDGRPPDSSREITAAMIIGQSGSIDRFKSKHHAASYNSTASSKHHQAPKPVTGSTSAATGE